VRDSETRNPDIVRSFESTFASYWADQHFEPYDPAESANGGPSGAVTGLGGNGAMVSTEDFFKAQHPAAALKHGVLLRYAKCFAGRAGSQTRGRVSFVDGDAGPGRYEDGTPGSPFLLAQAANESELFGRETRIVLVEASPDLATSLGAAIGYDKRTSILNARFENVVDDVLAATARTATLVFIDPFSIGIGHEQVGRILAASQPGRPVDILYHFSDQAVARLAERVVKAGPADPVQEMASRIDALMGPLDWRTEFQNTEPGQRSFQVAADIARKFAGDVARPAGASSTTIDVRKRPGHLPIYSLSLIAKNVQANWDFADIAGKAYIDWAERCEDDDHEAYLEDLTLTGKQRSSRRNHQAAATSKTPLPYVSFLIWSTAFQGCSASNELCGSLVTQS